MAEPKNPFDFGTGSIDKDQWLRDIDAEQDDFVSRYSSAVNKHRAALIREAFADLRRRIANGDMLNRTADGLYQFGSALNREDKHMQEAYQRALGFMGDLARRQIQAPPAAEPEKKKYSTKTLNDRFIKYFNPSGSQESFTSLWNSYDDATRLAKLKEFLGEELNNLGNYLDVEDYASMNILKTRINDFINSPDITNLNKLGFTRNYLSLLKTEEQLEEAPKSELEQVLADLAAAQEAQQVAQGRLYLDFNANRGTTNFDLSIPTYDFNKALLNYLSSALSDEQLRLAATFNPNFNLNEAKAELAKRYIALQQQNLNNYFANFAISWKPNYESGLSNRDMMQKYLSQLFATYNKGTNKDGTPITDYAYDWKKYFTLIGDNQFLINGSLDRTKGRYAYYVPGQGIIESNILDTNNPYIAKLLGYTIPSLKEGGKIKFLQSGGEFDYNAWAALQEKPKAQVTSKPQQTSTSKLEDSEKMDFGDIVNIAGPLALDITSMLSANGVGVGTAISAGSGIASTVWQGINDWDNKDVWGSLGSIGTNLISDGVGLIPGLGIAGKVGKIARGLAKHAKYLGLAFNAIGAHDAAQVLYKGIKNGFDLSQDEWKTLTYGLAGVAQGSAGVKRANRVNLRRGAANKRIDVTYDRNGKKHVKVTDKLESDSPIGTEDTRYAATKESLIETRGITKGNRITSAPSKRYKLMLEQPKDNIVLYPWETIQKPSIDLFGAKKINKTYEESLEWLKKKKAKRNGTTNTETPAETPKEKYGGVLKALRNGGIIKGEFGIPGGLGSTNYRKDMEAVDMSLDPNELYYDTREAQSINFGSAFSTPTFVDYTKRVANGAAGNRGTMGNLKLTQGMYMHDDTQNYLSALDALKNYYTMDNGKNIMGDVYNYYNNVWLKDKNNLNKSYKDFVIDYNKNVDTLRSRHLEKFNTGKDVVNLHGWADFNLLHRKMYGSYGKYKNDKGEISDDWNSDPKVVDILGESTWRRLPNAFNGKEYDALRRGFLKNGDVSSHIYMDNNGHLRLEAPPEGESLEPYKVGTKTKEDTSGVVDSERGNKPTFNTEYKNPNDPTPYIIAGKTALGLYGNKNIYLNLLDEMPQAPLRDPIDRKLAIVGWQEAIKLGLNQLADLRNATWMQHGSDQLTNLAGMYETEGKGRDIMNGQFMKDSGRLFETALKSWNLDNEDTLYNLGVGDANRRAIADRARMMAQIRAAWRSGDNNILMGALSDTGNWMLKRYQREQDIIDKARELELGTPEEWAQSEYTSRLGELANKKEADLTPADKAKIEAVKAQVLREMRSKYSEKYYNTFGTNLFGGGSYSTMAKDGTKLEVAKLKARSKDNDRYVSMMKDLRTTRSRRRRR